MASQSTSSAWLDRPVFKNPSKLLTIENLLILVIIVLAILSRFVILGERVMSHDEVNHVVPSYDLYQGRGYRHDPITHGPFQFHIVALSYFLFGDNDFTSRVPAATFSVAAILFLMFAYRRYLGRAGALIAGLLFLISPFMMFYGRYTRNEGYIELLGVVLFYGILRYLEKGDRLGMFLVTFATVMHFIVKETSFIYTAQALIFLFVMFLVEARRLEIRNPGRYNRFMLLMVLAMALVIAALGVGMIKTGTAAAAAPAAQAGPEAAAAGAPSWRVYVEIILVAGAGVLGALGLFTLAKDIGWSELKKIRSFSLIVLIGTLILPMLSPFPVTMLGRNPLDYTTTANMLPTLAFIVLLFIVGVVVGLWWNMFVWLQNAFLFWAIFIVFYTTFFTNGNGFFTGIVGSLGYWLSQQGVERGSQPRYYYALIQMPIYEFLAYLGTILALYFGIRYRKFITLPGFAPAHSPQVENEPALEEAVPVTGQPETETAGAETGAQIYRVSTPEPAVENGAAANLYRTVRPLPVLAFFIYWALTSLLAYSIAGERMPWLTVHVTMGFLLASAWGLGYLVDTVDWKAITRLNGLIAVILIPVFFAALASMFGSLLGANPPFQGNTLDQLQATNRFIIALVATFASLAGIIYLLRDWAVGRIAQMMAVVFFLLMAVLTARAAYRASFINYDYAFEYLVYAHATPWPKDVLKQIEDISRRTSGEKSIQVAYSSDMLYPYWWYLRDYPNHLWYQTNPTRDLRNYAVIIAGEDVFGKIEPVVGNNYYQFDYVRLWWPNQDYYNLSWDRIKAALLDPKMRAAVFNIWLNRDYTEYAKLTNEGQAFSPETWSPAARMRVYIRKDITAKIWNYGAAPAAASPEATDPYAKKMIQLPPAQVIGSGGNQPGQFQAPRGIAVAPDGTLYVADSRNNRIQHIDANGQVIKVWGAFGDAATGAQNAPGGSFNEPWDVAVGKDGSVYVSDTWNHRIQKFTADGTFVKMWGYFGQGEKSDAFWGPRGLAVDQNGRLYVMDTGNKRVVIFDPDGNFIAQFGSAGFDKGQFDEPVGIAIDQSNNVYVTDTWNQRIQVFAPDGPDGKTFNMIRSWDVVGWEGQSLDNKPFLAVSPVNGHVFVTDPEKPRMLEFDPDGNFVRGWGDFSTNPQEGFGLASGVAVAENGDVWVSDGSNNVLLRFQMPK